MAFRGKESIRTKIVIGNQILEQVSHLNYLENNIGCDRNYDINVKLGGFQMIYGTINCIFRKLRYKIKVQQSYGSPYNVL